MLILGARDVTLTRTAAGTRGTDGRFVPGAATTSTIRASVQPADGEDLALLPEGMRSKRTIKVYTSTALRTVDVVAGTAPDVLTVDGADYVVHAIRPHSAVLPHTHAIAVRVQE